MFNLQPGSTLAHAKETETLAPCRRCQREHDNDEPCVCERCWKDDHVYCALSESRLAAICDCPCCGFCGICKQVVFDSDATAHGLELYHLNCAEQEFGYETQGDGRSVWPE